SAPAEYRSSGAVCTRAASRRQVVVWRPASWPSNRRDFGLGFNTSRIGTVATLLGLWTPSVRRLNQAWLAEIHQRLVMDKSTDRGLDNTRVPDGFEVRGELMKEAIYFLRSIWIGSIGIIV